MRIVQPSLPIEENANRVLSGEMRGEREVLPKFGDNMLILPVVVHRPDFFGSGAGADKIDLGLGNAIQAAEPGDDVVGEAVRDGPRIVLAGGVVVLLAQHLRAAGILGVQYPAGDGDTSVVRGERAKGNHGRVGWIRGPLRQADLLRRAGQSPVGAMLFETMSKTPALVRSLKSVASKMVLS